MQPLNSITENKGNAVMYQGSDASPRLQNSAQGENEDILIDFLRYANQKDPNAFPIMGNAALWGGSEKAAEPAEVSGASAGGGSNVVTFPFQEKEMSERSVLIQPLDACCPENENLLSVLYHNTDKGYLILSLDENDHILIKGGN